MMNAPCKDCERRKLLCHGCCKEYKEWKKAYEARKEADRQQKEYRIPERVMREYWRTLRYQNRRKNK